MVLSTDMCVARMILGLNPLQGPILLDYLTNGIERAHLVEALFERVPSIPRESLNMTKAAQNYWRLVKKWLNPTRAAIYGWVRDLMRHTIVLDELFFESKYDNHVLAQVHTICRGVMDLNGCTEHYDLSQFESTYATALRDGGKRAAMKVALSPIYHDHKDMDIRHVGTELIDILRRSVGEMWHLSLYKLHEDGEKDMKTFEIRERYQATFYKDLLGDKDEEHFLKFPSFITARNLSLQDSRQQISLDLQEMDDSDYWDRIKVFAFYSLVDEQLMSKWTEAYVTERTHEGGVLNWKQFHKELEPDLYQDVMIENSNYGHITEYISRGPEEPTAVKNVVSGVEKFGKEEENPEKEKTESGMFTLIAFAAVIGFLFLQA